EKARLENLVKNEEICSLISAVGIDIGNNEDIGKLRYNKIIIMTDADVDGQHIRTLLWTVFYRQMAQLVVHGHICAARPPPCQVNGHTNGNDEVIYEQELHEVREVNRGLEELRKHGLAPADLVPAPRVAGREPPPRLVLENGDTRRLLPALRDLVGEVRRLG